jgi:hypothetical protein
VGLPGHPTPRLEAQDANKPRTIAAKTKPVKVRFIVSILKSAKFLGRQSS